jgi:hypothetical protein
LHYCIDPYEPCEIVRVSGIGCFQVVVDFNEVAIFPWREIGWYSWRICSGCGLKKLDWRLDQEFWLAERGKYSTTSESSETGANHQTIEFWTSLFLLSVIKFYSGVLSTIKCIYQTIPF